MREKALSLTKFIKRNFDFFLLALIISGFVFVASTRLSTVPVPDTDEAMTLQIPYEMLTRGKLAFPMFNYLGGNIENNWHSFTPVFFILLSGFLKFAGWGLVEGRAFNLATAALMLVIVFLIARRYFGRAAALIAVVLIISDPAFLARSRLIRNDILPASFGLLAFYIYEKAEERKSSWLHFAAGLAAGAGVMCHTNLIYMLAVIFVSMLLRRGWRIIKSPALYQFAAGALLVMSYEIISDILDYRNFILQNSRDTVHFRILEAKGWLNNILEEPSRYADWFNARGLKIAPSPALLHIFLLLTVVAVIYLAARCVIQIKRGNLKDDPRARVFIATLVIILFFTVVTQRKIIQYVIHLSPWFALSVAILLTDAFFYIKSLREKEWRWGKPAYKATIATAVLAIAIYGYALLKIERSYLAQVRNPQLASFDEIATALRSIVPEDVCPASIGSGYLWLAFIEYDQCYFSHIEARLDEPLRIDGKDYALMLRPRFMSRLRKLTGGPEKYHLLGELSNTVYGSFLIYYTGSDSRYLSLEPKKFYFFGPYRGYISDEQIKNAREVWSAESSQLTRVTSGAVSAKLRDDADDTDENRNEPSEEVIRLDSIDLKANVIYHVSVEDAAVGRWELLLLDDETGSVIQRIESSEQNSRHQLDDVFKSPSGGRVRLAVRMEASNQVAPLPFSRIKISEISVD